MERDLQLESVDSLMDACNKVIYNAITCTNENISKNFIEAVVKDDIDSLDVEELYENIENMEIVLNCKYALYALSTCLSVDKFKLSFGFINVIASQLIREYTLTGMHINMRNITNLVNFGDTIQTKCDEMSRKLESMPKESTEDRIAQAKYIISVFENEQWFTAGNTVIGYYMALGYIYHNYKCII